MADIARSIRRFEDEENQGTPLTGNRGKRLSVSSSNWIDWWSKGANRYGFQLLKSFPSSANVY